MGADTPDVGPDAVIRPTSGVSAPDSSRQRTRRSVLQLATMTGSVESGYTAVLSIAV